MSIGTLLVAVLVVLMIGALPQWRHSATWGYGPSGAFGAAVVVVTALLLTHHL